MKQNRRIFLKKSAIAATAASIGPYIFPSPLHGSGIAPTDKITVGLIGCRGMGMSNLKSFLKNEEIDCAALCDIDNNILKERSFETEKITGKAPDLYEDYRKMLERKDIDTVIIGTPDHWHCLPMIEACETGKDVYVEKPLANTIEECFLMEKAVTRYNQVVQVGQWQRSDPHWKTAVDFVHSGKLGKIRNVKVWAYLGWKGKIPIEPDQPAPDGVNYDLWLGPAPDRPFNPNRFHFNFRWFWDYAGGLMTDWGVHLLDYALYGMKQHVPKSIVASGGKYAYPGDAMETPDTLQTIYEFEDFGIAWEHTIGISRGHFDRYHGVAFIGENGTLVVNRNGWEVIPEKDNNNKDKLERVSLQEGTNKGLDLHVKNFIECMKTRNKPNAPVEIGANIARFAQFGNIAYRTGEKIYWNPETKNFGDNHKANELVNAYYRQPWHLPKV